MNYIVEVEKISGCMRVFDSWSEPGKDPYEFCATVVYYKNGTIAELKGVKTSDSVNFVSMRESICKSFYLQGVNYIFWERKSRDKNKRIFINTRTQKIERRILL